MTKKVRTYSDEFKAEAVKKIADNNGNISATAKQLGIAMQTEPPRIYRRQIYLSQAAMPDKVKFL